MVPPPPPAKPAAAPPAVPPATAIAATPAVPAAALTGSAGPEPSRPWSKPAGYAALGAGAIAAGVGVFLGSAGRSDINKAESSYRANGNAYFPDDLDTLASGNSKAKSANVLFIASGVLFAAGALLTLAF